LRGRVLFPGYAAGEIFVDEDNNEALIRNKLVFLADAYNGSAVDQVDFRISGPNGEVYTHLEEDPAYCVFGGGTPDCNVFVFAQNNYTWPNGERIENDVFYDVDIEIIAFDHRTANWNWSFRVQGVPEVSEPTESTLNVQIVQTGPGTDAPMVSSGLVFQAQAFDSAQGTHDGDGIDHVILSVLRNGVEVYQRRENDPGYCAFSGGEPNCNVFIFAENGNSWPNGPSIEPGPHILRAVAFTGDGRKAEDTMTVDIQLP
jgi:hypothetical protein